MIDQEKIKQLFDDRARLYGRIPILNVALFQEGHGDLAQKRDEIERETVMRIIGSRIGKDWTVLDIGCGTGRWAFRLAPLVGHVYAFDISLALIKICRVEQLDIKNVTFATGKIDRYPDGFPMHYNLFIVSGVCLYTNDEQWYQIAAWMFGRVSSGTLIVIREACGSHGRYEVENQWSQELGVEYSAIYRSPDWFRGFFAPFCRTIYDKPLLPPELEKWQETHQRLFIFEVI